MPTSKSVIKKNDSFTLPLNLSGFSKSNWWDEIVDQEDPSSKYSERKTKICKYSSDSVSVGNLSQAASRKRKQNVTKQDKRANSSKNKSDKTLSSQNSSQMEYKLDQKSNEHSSSKTSKNSYKKLKSHSHLLKEDCNRKLKQLTSPNCLSTAGNSINTSHLTRKDKKLLMNPNVLVKKLNRDKIACIKRKLQTESLKNNKVSSKTEENPLCTHVFSSNIDKKCSVDSEINMSAENAFQHASKLKPIDTNNLLSNPVLENINLQTNMFKPILNDVSDKEANENGLCIPIFGQEKIKKLVAVKNVKDSSVKKQIDYITNLGNKQKCATTTYNVENLNIRPCYSVLNKFNSKANKDFLVDKLPDSSPNFCVEEVTGTKEISNALPHDTNLEAKDFICKKNLIVKEKTFSTGESVDKEKCTSYDTEKLSIRACYVVLNKVHSKAVSNKNSHIDELTDSNPNFCVEEITDTNGISGVLPRGTNLDTKDFVHKKCSKDCNANVTQSERKLRSSSMSVKFNNEFKQSGDVIEENIQKKTFPGSSSRTGNSMNELPLSTFSEREGNDEITVMDWKPECSTKYCIDNSVPEDFTNDVTHAKRKLRSSRYVSVKFPGKKFNKDVLGPKCFKKDTLLKSGSHTNEVKSFYAQNKSVNLSKNQAKIEVLQSKGIECHRHLKKNIYCHENPSKQGRDEAFVEIPSNISRDSSSCEMLSAPNSNPQKQSVLQSNSDSSLHSGNLNKPTSPRRLRATPARANAQINNCKWMVLFHTNSLKKNLDKSHSIATQDVSSNRDDVRSSERIKASSLSQYKSITRRNSRHCIDEEKVSKENLKRSVLCGSISESMILRSSSKIYNEPFCDFNGSKENLLEVSKSTSCKDISSFITPKSKTLTPHSDQIKGKCLFGSYNEDNCNSNKKNNLGQESNLNLYHSSDRQPFKNSSLNEKSRAAPKKTGNSEFRFSVEDLGNKNSTVYLNWKAIHDSKTSHFTKTDKMSALKCKHNVSLVERKKVLKTNKYLAQPVSNFYIKTRNNVPSHFYREQKFPKRMSKHLHSNDFEFLEPPEQ